MNVKYMFYLFSSSFIVSHNIVCLAHMYTGSVFIATPTIVIVKRAKKSPVSDLQNTFVCIHYVFHIVKLRSRSRSGEGQVRVR